VAARTFLLRYSWRNLWRGQGRTILVLALIAPVFLSLLLMIANSRALDGQVMRLESEAGTLIQVRGRATFGHINQAGGLNRLTPAGLEPELARLDHVTKVEPSLVAIITTLSASPTTSTPSRKLADPSSTPLPDSRKRCSSVARGTSARDTPTDDTNVKF